MEKHWSVKMWKEGRNFDLWHVSHFIAGILFAYLVQFLGISLYLGFAGSFILMVGWELFEINLGIKETKFNMYFDVIFSVIAFWMTIFLENKVFDDESFKSFFWVSLAIYIVMGIWGFWAFKMRVRGKKQLD